jgi:high-affinity iron transporter
MLAALLVVFRETIEAGLVVGIVLAATQGVPGRGWRVAQGIAAGLLGACCIAAFAGAISEAVEGMGQEIFNAAILAVAVVMLAAHNIWMARHGREMAGKMKAVGEAVKAGTTSMVALAAVVGIAVLREGSEVVLFLYGIAISADASAFSMIAGSFAGLAGGVLLGAGLYLGLLRIPTRHLFRVTSAMITLLAAGMAAQAVAFLQQADVLTLLTNTVWNSSSLLSEGSIAGRALHTLVGYTAQPSGMQLLVYTLTLGIILALTRVFGQSPAQRA